MVEPGSSPDLCTFSAGSWDPAARAGTLPSGPRPPMLGGAYAKARKMVRTHHTTLAAGEPRTFDGVVARHIR